MVQLQVRYNTHTNYFVYHSLFSARYIARELINRYPQIKVIYLIDRETGELLDTIKKWGETMINFILEHFAEIAVLSVLIFIILMLIATFIAFIFC